MWRPTKVTCKWMVSYQTEQNSLQSLEWGFNFLSVFTLIVLLFNPVSPFTRIQKLLFVFQEIDGAIILVKDTGTTNAFETLNFSAKIIIRHATTGSDLEKTFRGTANIKQSAHCKQGVQLFRDNFQSFSLAVFFLLFVIFIPRKRINNMLQFMNVFPLNS